MPLTLTITNYPFRDRLNNCIVRRGRLTGPAAYIAGGVSINNGADFGWGETHVLLGTIRSGDAIRLLHLDFANQKVMIFVPNTDNEVAADVDLSGFTGEIIAFGQ